MDGEIGVIIVDEFTGRKMVGRAVVGRFAPRRWRRRRSLRIKPETQTMATVTLQNFFKLYKRIAGIDRDGVHRS